MSSRDIEGENLLYLPHAKIYPASCAAGSWIAVGQSEDDALQWRIQLEIRRGAATVFAGETGARPIKRPFNELVGYLFCSQRFPNGAVLLIGAGVVCRTNSPSQRKTRHGSRSPVWAHSRILWRWSDRSSR